MTKLRIRHCIMITDSTATIAFATKPTAGSGSVELHCAGAWTLSEIAQLERRLDALSWPDGGDLVIDASEPRRIRWRPILHNMQIAGVEALPITGQLSLLMGIVIAYQGADQLQRFGANIFIADLVDLAMLRELSPLLTAIIIVGRSGSAYTAQIGTMKITEEIDALRTIGVVPQELLVLPKMLALIMGMPLLTVYTDVTGVLGGMIMAQSKLNVSFGVFLDRLNEAVSLSSYVTGISKAPAFAMIIALVGCYRGFQVTRSAESVSDGTMTPARAAARLVALAK